MKKVITIVVDEALAKEIFDEYYSLSDFISVETEDEAKLREDGWATWNEMNDDEDEDNCPECMSKDN